MEEEMDRKMGLSPLKRWNCLWSCDSACQTSWRPTEPAVPDSLAGTPANKFNLHYWKKKGKLDEERLKKKKSTRLSLLVKVAVLICDALLANSFAFHA
jgi:hypothetical protein